MHLTINPIDHLYFLDLLDIITKSLLDRIISLLTV